MRINQDLFVNQKWKFLLWKIYFNRHLLEHFSKEQDRDKLLPLKSSNRLLPRYISMDNFYCTLEFFFVFFHTCVYTM